MAFPIELITLLGGTVLGGILKVVGLWVSAKSDREKATLKALNSKADIVKNAREYKNKNFEWTRRFIAVSSTTAIIILPIVASILIPELPTTFVYSTSEGGFWPFTEAKTVIKTIDTVGGILILPFHTHMMAAISGMYFGGSIVGHNR